MIHNTNIQPLFLQKSTMFRVIFCCRTPLNLVKIIEIMKCICCDQFIDIYCEIEPDRLFYPVELGSTTKKSEFFHDLRDSFVNSNSPVQRETVIQYCICYILSVS